MTTLMVGTERCMIHLEWRGSASGNLANRSKQRVWIYHPPRSVVFTNRFGRAITIFCPLGAYFGLTIVINHTLAEAFQKKYRISLTVRRTLHICRLTKTVSPVFPELSRPGRQNKRTLIPLTKSGEDDWPPPFVGGSLTLLNR